MRGSTAGLADCMLRGTGNSVYTSCLYFLDMLISSFVISPLVVGYWRGTWNMTSLLVYPNDPKLAGFLLTTLGLFGQFMWNYLQGPMKGTFSPNRHRLVYYMVSRLYTYIFGFCCIFTWAGLWLLIAEYITLDPKPMGLMTGISIACLCLLRALRNIFGVPFYVAIDSPPDYFTVRTMFQKGVS